MSMSKLLMQSSSTIWRKCNHCDNIFPTKKELLLHLTSHEEICPYSCSVPDCDSRFDTEKKLLGIAPFAKHKCKEYSIKNILKLIDLIGQEINILIFGDQNNTTKIKSIIKGKSNVFDASSGFTLEEEMEIISNLDLMISMDSANGHIASLFGIKVLTIWGATHPFTGYGPFKQPEKNSITPNLRNYPNLPVTIYGSACPEKYLDVINTIKPEKIAKRINEII